MPQYAVISDGKVIGISNLATETPPAGHVLIGEADVQIGDEYDGSVFSRPTPVTGPRLRLSKREFRAQFTMAEKQAIYTAAESSVDVRIFLDDLMAVDYVDVDFQQTIDGVNALEAAGLIAAGRAAEILAGVDE